MVGPITGPITKVSGEGWLYLDTKVYYRQKRPYSEILPYTREIGVMHYFPEEWRNNMIDAVRAITFARSPDSLSRDLSWNKARARFLDKIGESASLGVSLAQGRQAMSMMTARLGQLSAAFRGVRNLDAKMVSRGLGISERRAHHVMQPYKTRSGLAEKRKVDPFGHGVKPPGPDVKYGAPRDLANLWLEFWFGWKPAVSDINQAMKVLDEPFKAVRIKSSASNVGDSRGFGGAGPAREVIRQIDRYRTRFGADIEITNPNLRLAQQMGILNPAVIALDLVPWSFVLGWFWNLQEYLSSFTDFAGLTLHRAYIVQITETKLTGTFSPCEFCPDWEKDLYRSSKSAATARLYSRQPMASVPRPRMRLSTFRLSPTRGLTAISLLVQKLPVRDAHKVNPSPGEFRF